MRGRQRAEAGWAGRAHDVTLAMARRPRLGGGASGRCWPRARFMARAVAGSRPGSGMPGSGPARAGCCGSCAASPSGTSADGHIGGRDEPFRSEIREHAKGRAGALEDFAVEMLARALSVRDIEDAVRSDDGRLPLSRTAVSELGERLWRDDRSFAARDPSEREIVCPFVDGIAERIRPGRKREPVIAAWSFAATGALPRRANGSSCA